MESGGGSVSERKYYEWNHNTTCIDFAYCMDIKEITALRELDGYWVENQFLQKFNQILKQKQKLFTALFISKV